jgi:hypothetical protein
MTWRVPSGERLPVFQIVAVPHFPSWTCTHSSNRGLYFLDCERPPRVCGFLVDRCLYFGETNVAFVHDRVLAACTARAESGDARVRRRHAQ